MTTRGKIVLFALFLALAYFGFNKLIASGKLFKKADTQSVMLSSIDLPAAPSGSRATLVVPLAPLPGTAPPKTARP
ncbi:hypothetical protein [Hymenobacter sp. BRD67]|uniref:hypothetical protein n=1 Tax=Hymenobacter sp. BRD67 TaxID=2675877 RepID=UPI001564AB62|nr:hypothetical protein [Hymenobacter sp. BRD67]QKG51816.1 hypothetical protein GKZ67_03370 [Hymenobacter sp. BRD67]